MQNMPADWQLLLQDDWDRDSFVKLAEFVDAERAAFPDSIFPADDQVFSALTLTPVEKTRVLILGQDPYPTRGHAQGLAFSVQPEVKPLPASLRNIFKELVSDLDLPLPVCGSLIPWAKQGVLLLNTVLTVREGQANSHQKRGWEVLTDAIIARLSQRQGSRIVFVLWGKPAQKKEPLIDTGRHAMIKSAHPSPLSAHTGFFGSRPFSKINSLLEEAGQTKIDWTLQ
jgi:uracil-DNA glycosylase